jgi:hypothetical protein
MIELILIVLGCSLAGVWLLLTLYFVYSISVELYGAIK